MWRWQKIGPKCMESIEELCSLERGSFTNFSERMTTNFCIISEKRKRTQPPGSEMSEDYPKENDSST